MILTDYYKAEHLPDAAMTRYDVTASTGSYEFFEYKLRNKKGEQFFYFGMCLTGGILPAKTDQTRQLQKAIIFPVYLCQMLYCLLPMVI